MFVLPPPRRWRASRTPPAYVSPGDDAVSRRDLAGSLEREAAGVAVEQRARTSIPPAPCLRFAYASLAKRRSSGASPRDVAAIGFSPFLKVRRLKRRPTGRTSPTHLARWPSASVRRRRCRSPSSCVSNCSAPLRWSHWLPLGRGCRNDVRQPPFRSQSQLLRIPRSAAIGLRPLCGRSLKPSGSGRRLRVAPLCRRRRDARLVAHVSPAPRSLHVA